MSRWAPCAGHRGPSLRGPSGTVRYQSTLTHASRSGVLPAHHRSWQATPPGRATLRTDIAEGLRTLWRDRCLRGLCIATALCNVGMGAVIATLVLLATRWLGLNTAQYMAAMTCYAAGALAGGALAARIASGLGRIRSICLAGAAQTAALAAIGGIRSFAALATGLAVFGLMGMVWNINTTTLMQQHSPAQMLGRISSAFRTVAISGAPLGALLGGAVATAWGLNTPALLAAVLFVLAVAALLPATTARTVPQGPEELRDIGAASSGSDWRDG